MSYAQLITLQNSGGRMKMTGVAVPFECVNGGWTQAEIQQKRHTDLSLKEC